jgi:hypothetical protein
MLKNAQMRGAREPFTCRSGRQIRVELCEIPLAGAPEIFRRERFKTVPYRWYPQRLALLDKTQGHFPPFRKPECVVSFSKREAPHLTGRG